MHVFKVVIPLLIGGYFIIIFVLARLVVPFMGFTQYEFWKPWKPPVH